VRASGCPAFPSKDTVLNRPDGDPARPSTVAPGRFDFEAGTSTRDRYSVVWWDPAVLHLGAVSSFGLRRDDLIVKDGDMFAVEDRMQDYVQWREDRDRAVAQAARPSLRVQTSTFWAAAVAEEGLDEVLAASARVEIVELPGAAGRPRGMRFGALVHAVLATAPLDASDEIVRRTADVQGRLLLAGSDETQAAATVVSAVLRHELMARARASARVRRETPVTWLDRDGTLIEGVLDLAFEENGATTIVDFKTDHELSAGEARYRAQVQQYVDAVAAATKRPAAGVLFKI
jgi:ATP-dependent exoDNAse (exonuclease V) beta subunit